MKEDKSPKYLLELPADAIRYITFFLSLRDWVKFKETSTVVAAAAARSYNLSFDDIPPHKLERIQLELLVLQSRERAIDRPCLPKFEPVLPQLEFKLSLMFVPPPPPPPPPPIKLDIKQLMAEAKVNNQQLKNTAKSGCAIL